MNPYSDVEVTKEYTIREFDETIDPEALEAKTALLNRTFMNGNKVVLDNDPRSPFIIHGLTTNFPDCYLWVVQDLADLLSKSNSLKFTDYYNYWTKEQLDEVVTWRTIQQD